ncbi:disease resistance protein L6-like isoform X2 [Syzygium oleosum]|uniref:disease resistance protein L6-like isoform X2 n=1 Tax=Syzygium oleosum TaxID=219896 RepID=UPI0024BB9FF1|nr:disease resistance protein L6-like isoform X2 [Syzygium oleosum]
MASPETGTSANNTFGGEYEVFLSFRGLDTRRTFTNSLHHALLHAGIRVFIDDEELRFGERISDNLPQAIDDSKLYIPIFSRNYALSHWCLDELAKMVENASKSKEDGKKVILPIFYDVEPNDVKLKTELYSEVISNLEKQMKGQKNKFSSKDIKMWQQALQEVGGIKGWESKKYSGDGELIQEVVDEVVVRLETRQRPVTKDLVGMGDQIAAINNLLDIDSGGVRLIAIYGMGGIGKTTLANIIFNQLRSEFRKNCSFLEHVRETALQQLQEKLLSDMSYSGEASKIHSIDHGIKRIGDTICNKKMLIVLDDIDKGNQIQNLIPVNSLYPGTTILVTTRDKSVLNIRGFANKFKDYEMVGLSDEDALKLFSKHAFNDDSPRANYHTLSKSIVSTVDGLPLALEVIGSSLFGQEKKKIWEDRLKKLKKTPYRDVMQKLRISYDALEPDQQQIFLDVACFFVGENKTDPMYMWEDCELYPEEAIDVLIQRCMIKVLDGDRFGMHDQLRDLGRAIARQDRTRLWDKGDIICELKKREIKEGVQVEALRLLSWGDPITITSEEIKRFPHIRFLSLHSVNCQGDFTGCLSELKWIDLGYPWDSTDEARCNRHLEGTNLLHLENAAVVNLYGLQFTDDVFKSLIEKARKLKVLTIMRNESIHGTPIFSKDSVLEKLTIRWNSFFSEIDCSIGKLRWLTDLSVESCHKLRKLPEQIGELRSLRHLSLRSCHCLIELPDSVSKLESLTKLDVSFTRITRLPDSIGRLPSLSSVYVSATLIEELPSTMSEFRQLQTLDLVGCHGIQELPMLPKSLTTLLLISTSLLIVPNLSYLTNLVELVLSGGSYSTAKSNIIQTCDLRWIRKLFKLSKLRFCFPNVHAPTIELGSLSLLKELTLYGLDLPTFKQLPSNLIVLELYDTRGKQVHLDRLPPSEKETVSSSSRKSRENKAYEQHHVQLLYVLELSEISCIQDCKSSERLACLLEELGCNELQAPELIDHWRGAFQFPSSLKMLRKFVLSGFPELQDIQFVSTLESLEEFSVEDCSSLKSLGGLSNLKNLKDLSIIRCVSLQVVEGIEKLEYSYQLKIEECRSMERILDASIHITYSASFSQLNRAVHRPHDPSSIPRSSSTTASNDDPSPLKMLKKFLLWRCPEVQDIQFVSTFESLEEFYVRECSSLKSLGGLSNLKNLKQLTIVRCPSLQVVEGIDELEFLWLLIINGCRSMERIFDASSSKIPNECLIIIEDCEKLLNSSPDRHFEYWESYREKILNGTKQAPDSEIETTDYETETGDPLQEMNRENEEK